MPINLHGLLTRLTLATFVILFIVRSVLTAEDFRLNRETLQLTEKKYGKDASKRLEAWEELIRRDKNASDREKLEKTSHFFNSRIRFVNDQELWGVDDYWATPVEFLSRGGGDCEDFAIAKYFTLKAMGMADDKLRITYVKAIQMNMHHMVLTYYSSPDAEPLVLDNLVDSINPASKRTDLLPIFSFNGSGLWTAKQRGQGKMAGSSSRLRLWRELTQKMSDNKL